MFLSHKKVSLCSRNASTKKIFDGFLVKFKNNINLDSCRSIIHLEWAKFLKYRDIVMKMESHQTKRCYEDAAKYERVHKILGYLIPGSFISI